MAKSTGNGGWMQTVVLGAAVWATGMVASTPARASDFSKFLRQMTGADAPHGHYDHAPYGRSHDDHGHYGGRGYASEHGHVHSRGRAYDAPYGVNPMGPSPYGRPGYGAYRPVPPPAAPCHRHSPLNRGYGTLPGGAWSDPYLAYGPYGYGAGPNASWPRLP